MWVLLIKFMIWHTIHMRWESTYLFVFQKYWIIFSFFFVENAHHLLQSKIEQFYHPSRCDNIQILLWAIHDIYLGSTVSLLNLRIIHSEVSFNSSVTRSNTWLPFHLDSCILYHISSESQELTLKLCLTTFLIKK